MTGSFEAFDSVSRNSLALFPPKWVDKRALASGVAETFDVPIINGARPNVVLFSCTANFYVGYTPVGSSDVVAAITSTDVTDGSGFELSPTFRNVSQTSRLSVVADAAATLTIAYYS